MEIISWHTERPIKWNNITMIPQQCILEDNKTEKKNKNICEPFKFCDVFEPFNFFFVMDA